MRERPGAYIYMSSGRNYSNIIMAPLHRPGKFAKSEVFIMECCHWANVYIKIFSYQVAEGSQSLH